MVAVVKVDQYPSNIFIGHQTMNNLTKLYYAIQSRVINIAG